MPHLRYAFYAFGVAAALFIGMLLFIELGRYLGIRQSQKHGPQSRAGVGGVDSAVYALLALLIGFTFSGAATRFDHRRELIVQEVDIMSTAWQRIDLLPAAQQPALRAAFLQYVDAVIASYTNGWRARSLEATRDAAIVARAQNDVWSRSVAAVLSPGGEPARVLLLQSLNDMFGVVDAERFARQIHPPLAIFAMLLLAALAGALFAGYALASGPVRNWIHSVGVAATISMAVFVIIELEYPRLGLIRVDEMDQALVDLRKTMN